MKEAACADGLSKQKDRTDFRPKPAIIIIIGCCVAKCLQLCFSTYLAQSLILCIISVDDFLLCHCVNAGHDFFLDKVADDSNECFAGFCLLFDYLLIKGRRL